MPAKDEILAGNVTAPFTGHNNDQGLTATVSPGYPNQTLYLDANGGAGAPGTGPLKHASRSDTFIARLFVENTSTQEIKYLKWIKWEAKWDVNFTITYNPQSGVTTVSFTKAVWSIKEISRGDGEGPSPPATTNFIKDFLPSPP